MSAAWRIAREEWRALARNRAGWIASLLILLLVAASAVVSLERRAALSAERARLQAGADAEFDNQPARHPHRMVHYGQFVFAPVDPLASFDPGVDAFTGNTIFLEGHRQNSANFAEARQSSLLVRFGQLTPAFVLQTLAPLLILFLGFGSVARERERGTLRLLLAQGVGGGTLVAGKLIGLAGIALAIAAPAFVLLIGLAAAGAAGWGPVALLILGYAAWLLLWAALAVVVSAAVRSSRDALLALVGLWAVAVVLLPRALPEVAAARMPLPGRIESEVALHRDLKAIGDSHNPDDPYFAAFKARVLKRYGVDDVDRLPVQYAGLVGMEGERLTTDLYAQSAAAVAAREAAQNRLVRGFAVLSPVIALRDLSMALAGSDLAAHRRFLDAAEAFRYRFVQTLNRMQAELIPQVGAGQDPRVSADNWRRVPRFAYVPADPVAAGGGAIATGFAVLGGWLAGLGGLAVLAGRRLGRLVR